MGAHCWTLRNLGCHPQDAQPVTYKPWKVTEDLWEQMWEDQGGWSFFEIFLMVCVNKRGEKLREASQLCRAFEKDGVLAPLGGIGPLGIHPPGILWIPIPPNHYQLLQLSVAGQGRGEQTIVSSVTWRERSREKKKIQNSPVRGSSVVWGW